MKPQRRVESQPRIAPHDQQQLVERRDPGRQLGPVAERSAAIDDPAGARGGERTARLRRRNDLAHAIHARDADRPEPSPGLAELPGQTLLPALRQHDVLVHADNPVVPGTFEATIQAVGRARAVPDSVSLRAGSRGADKATLRKFALKIASSDTQTTNETAIGSAPFGTV